ncbi:unnamed protein product, partial [Didymodactylos carnosus]
MYDDSSMRSDATVSVINITSIATQYYDIQRKFFIVLYPTTFYYCLIMDPYNTLVPTNSILSNGGIGTYPMNADAFGIYPLNAGIQQRPYRGGFLSRIPNLFIPAIFLLAFSWLLQAIATFIPYWSKYSGVGNSRAGLWSARANGTMIQNFYFPINITENMTSFSFTRAQTKGYIVTVQFLMTFNFVFMLIVLILLVIDQLRHSRRSEESFLQNEQNSSETAMKYALLLYITYVM